MEPLIKFTLRISSPVALLCLALAWPPSLLAANGLEQIETALRNRVTAGARDKTGATQAALDWTRLQQFYASRNHRLVWINGMQTNARAWRWRRILQQSAAEGLNPEAYHLSAIERLWFAKIDAEVVALELRLTDAYIRYIREARAGRLDPAEVDPDWHINPTPPDNSPMHWLSLEVNAFERVIATLPPPHAGYQGLRRALAQYRKLEYEGGWTTVPPGPALKLGAYDKRVDRLRLRLMAEGDLYMRSFADLHSFDLRVQQAVMRFQARHGLEADGVVGEGTRAAMNVPVAKRIAQLIANMERWRWLPRRLGERYVMVNTAGYQLEVKEQDHTALALRVITGHKETVTPVLGARLQSVQFNPFWIVPPKIAAEELLPEQQRDPDYLSSRGYRVFDKWGDDAKELDPATIKWSKFTKDNFRYKLRQDPGPKNALGQMKFIFQNDFAIYLHDTPHRRLFDQPKRALSHGCVRVEHPLKLALYLLKDNPGWDRAAIDDTLESGATETIRLPQPVPIYLVYWTAWVDAAGQVHFREDVYQRDRPLAIKPKK